MQAELTSGHHKTLGLRRARRTAAVLLEAAGLVLQSREVGVPRERATLEDFRDLFNELDIEESVREELREVTPATPASGATSWTNWTDVPSRRAVFR